MAPGTPSSAASTKPAAARAGPTWYKGHFAWEYKRKRRNLLEAYKQLQFYREDLENPPLLVVSDLDRFEIHTNFTAKPTVVHAFSLDELVPLHQC